MKKLFFLTGLIFYSYITNAEQKKLNIGLCITATNKYIKFVEPLINSARKFFLKNHKVTFFVFTNNIFNNQDDTKIVYIQHKPWPYSTMQRFHAYAQHDYLFKDFDYLFACDADMLFLDYVSDEILSERVGVRHPLFWNNNIEGKNQYERNKVSSACVYEHQGETYFAGGFYGGTKKEFLKLIKACAENIRKDETRNFIAIWHDESHLNRYFIDNPPLLVLDPSYCYPENHFKWIKGIFPFGKKLMALDKDYSER